MVIVIFYYSTSHFEYDAFATGTRISLSKSIFLMPLFTTPLELEARVFNVEGLAKLNDRTAEIFTSDVNAPLSSRI